MFPEGRKKVMVFDPVRHDYDEIILDIDYVIPSGTVVTQTKDDRVFLIGGTSKYFSYSCFEYDSSRNSLFKKRNMGDVHFFHSAVPASVKGKNYLFVVGGCNVLPDRD